MKTAFRLQTTSIVWLICTLISFAASAYLGYRFISVKNKFLAQAKEQAQKETSKAAKELNTFILMLKPIAQEVADEIGSKPMSKQEIIDLIKEKKSDDISGIGAAFLPYAIDPETKLFAPYYVESQGEEKLLFIEKVYDYTKPDSKWFHSTIKKGAHFMEPYYGETIQTIVAEYLTPIYRTDEQGNKKIIGVVYTDQSVEHLNHILDTLFLDHSGYWAILTKRGKFIGHPQDQLIHKQITIFDLAQQIGNTGLAQAGKEIITQQPVFFEYNNEITGAPSWLFSKPLKGTNWSIIGVFDKNELDIKPQVLRHNFILPSLPGVLFILFLTLFIFSFITKDHLARWWIVSAIISLALVGQIIWVWYASYTYPELRSEQSYVVKNKGDLYDYLKKETTTYRYGKKIVETTEFQHADAAQETAEQKTEEALLHGYKNPRYIPTGIFVNNLQFLSSNQILMSAYIWQRFTKDTQTHLPQGITFPQSTDTKITELSRISDNKSETILWEAHVKLNQTLHFNKYPFDTKALQIQLWHRYTKKNVVLVPDLNAYQLLNPRSLPGIDNDAYIPGWDIISSNFGYKKVNYTSNFGSYSVGPFGIYESADKSDVPELYFDIVIKRTLIDTLISDLLPIAVIAVLLFVILLTSTQQKLAVIGSCATVFFATIFAQIRFRSKIPEAQVVYFESFFFLLYAMILAILIITMMHYLKIHFRCIQFKDNLIAKLLYWPILCSSIAAITLWYLY